MTFANIRRLFRHCYLERNPLIANSRTKDRLMVTASKAMMALDNTRLNKLELHFDNNLNAFSVTSSFQLTSRHCYTSAYRIRSSICIDF